MHLLARSLRLAVLTAFLFAASSQAAILTVDCLDGPFTDIQDAISAAQSSDTVLVEACEDAAYSPFSIVGKDDLHVVGNDSPATGTQAGLGGLPRPSLRPPVTIDGDGGFQCVVVQNSDGVSIEGLTITNCGFHAIEVLSSFDVTVMRSRIEGGLESIRDQGSRRSRYIENVFVDGLFSIFLDGSEALVARNLILRDQATGINVLNEGNHLLGNEIRGSRREAIIDQGDGSRIERNRCLGNLVDGGQGEIVLNSGSSNAQVVANVTGDRIADFGTGTELAGNR